MTCSCSWCKQRRRRTLCNRRSRLCSLRMNICSRSCLKADPTAQTQQQLDKFKRDLELLAQEKLEQARCNFASFAPGQNKQIDLVEDAPKDLPDAGQVHMALSCSNAPAGSQDAGQGLCFVFFIA
ncbi:unnamed protein product [Effrenium voratum]|nr:unnamed protein product [Effrenium voratum]